MTNYSFPSPVLIIYLDYHSDGTDKKPASGYLETDNNKYFWSDPVIRMPEYDQPYALFLNHFDQYDFGSTDTLIAEIRAAYEKSTNRMDKELYSRWTAFWQKSANLYERHCLRSLLYDYELSCEKKYSSETLQEKNLKLDAFRVLYYRKEYSLMDVFAAYDLALFHPITKHRKEEILRDDDWGIEMVQNVSNVLTSSPIFVMKHFVSNMKENRIYLQRCEQCGVLFVRRDKRKSALCQGSYCEQTPMETPMKRYKQKNKLFKYREAKRNLTNYLSRMKKMGIFDDDFILEIRNESNAKKKRVESDMLQEENYLKWLNEKHQECIRLAEEKRISNKRKNDGSASGTSP